MKEFTFSITDPIGIHARPAGILVKEANKYRSTIEIEFNEKKSDAKRIFSVMGMNAKCGDNLKFIINGIDEDEAAEELQKFLKNNL